METGAITGYIDVAQLVLYLFWAFFFGLVYYLLQEGKREGYPLESDVPGEGPVRGWPDLPANKKTFLLPGGRSITVPRDEPAEELKAKPAERWRGAPLVPTVHGLEAGIGPGTWSHREDHVDSTLDGRPKIVPLRVAEGYSLFEQDPDPRGMAAVGADGVRGGTVSDVWVEQSDPLVRYIEIDLDNAGGKVLVPMNFAHISVGAHQLQVSAIMGDQFSMAPRTAHPEQITLLEEDKVMAFYGAGLLYADPSRAEPIL